MFFHLYFFDNFFCTIVSYYLYFSRLFSPSILIFLLYFIFGIIFCNCPEIVGFATVVGFSLRISPTHLLTSDLPRSTSLPSPKRFLLCSPLLLFSQGSCYSCFAAGAPAGGINPRVGGPGALFAPFALPSTSLAFSYVQIFSLFLIYCSLAVSGCTR